MSNTTSKVAWTLSNDTPLGRKCGMLVSPTHFAFPAPSVVMRAFNTLGSVFNDRQRTLPSAMSVLTPFQCMLDPIDGDSSGVVPGWLRLMLSTATSTSRGSVHTIRWPHASMTIAEWLAPLLVAICATLSPPDSVPGPVIIA